MGSILGTREMNISKLEEEEEEIATNITNQMTSVSSSGSVIEPKNIPDHLKWAVSDDVHMIEIERQLHVHGPDGKFGEFTTESRVTVSDKRLLYYKMCFISDEELEAIVTFYETKKHLFHKLTKSPSGVCRAAIIYTDLSIDIPKDVHPFQRRDDHIVFATIYHSEWDHAKLGDLSVYNSRTFCTSYVDTYIDLRQQ